MTTDKPPRYFIGVLTLADGREIDFKNAMFFHIDEQTVLVVNTRLDGYLDLVSHRKLKNLRVKKIQYSISIMEGEEYMTETFQHPFSKEVLIIDSHGLCLLTATTSKLFKFFPAHEVLKTKTKYPVSQFVA